MSEWYADVIVDISVDRLDRSFQYRIPDGMRDRVKPGVLVRIPFGGGNREIEGYVIRVTDALAVAPGRIKDLIGVEEKQNSVESRLIALAAWMRGQYGSTMIQALKTVLPVRKKVRQRKERMIRLAVPPGEAGEALAGYEARHQTARARLLAAVLYDGGITWSTALSRLHVTAAVIRAVCGAGLLTVQEETPGEDFAQPVGDASDFRLNDDQRRIAEDVRAGWEAGDERPVLLCGVTGSGKTAVYMELIDRVLAQGRQAILLIPEIALTYQTVRRFYRRFGRDVAVLHSRLSQGERAEQFERAKAGRIRIMIGPRSALFTPFPALGLIVIDEEHEPSYQSENAPCYHARETAIARARLEGAHVVMGSATPSVDAWYRAGRGEYRRYELDGRYGGRKLPGVQIVDLREELRAGNRSILSRSLAGKMNEHLARGGQVMLFLNRRGYAGFLSCRSCGATMRCPHCDVSLSLHRDGRMHCHYCGYRTDVPDRCPSCASPYLGAFRAGTEQIEEVVRRQFPGYRALRMDMDTTREKNGYARILSAFANREADILIGTQMIVKGHDFPGVTLVGVLAADLSLNMSDYRAGERTFQLLVQAVGRAGRGEREGEAVIQTYRPDHYSIRAAALQDYLAFYGEEIAYRKLMGYPPAAHMLAVRGSSRDAALLVTGMDYIRKYLERINDGGLSLIGPADEPVAKVADVFRRVFYIKGEDAGAVFAARRSLERYIEINPGFDKIKIQFDFDQ